MPVALFGGGHVGHAIVRLLGTLPVRVHWIDSRDAVFPAELPAAVQCEHSDPVQAAVATLAAGSRVLIMSFSHAEDLDIVAACLKRLRAQRDLPFIGLIGSKTKWATFRHRLEARGFGADELARVHLPDRRAGRRGQGTRGHRGGGGRPVDADPRMTPASGFSRAALRDKVYTLWCTRRSGADPVAQRPAQCAASDLSSERPRW